MQKVLDKWPQRFKDSAISILNRLSDQKRIIAVSLSGQSQPVSTSVKQCDPHLRIVQDYPTKFVVARQECKGCSVNPTPCFATARTQLANTLTNIIDINEYTLNNKLCQTLERRDRFYPPGVGRQQKFEQEILIPLFRDAARIELYDRYIGRSILESNADQYQLALEWILDVFKRESRLGESGTVKIYTGIFTRPYPNQPLFDRNRAITAFQNLEANMRDLLPKFQIFVKEEEQRRQMIHDRFLFTDQIGISIGRGFNLILDKRSSIFPRRLHDIHISYCTEVQKIRNAFNNLSTPFLYQSPNP
ncbi:hypothetical protein [Leptolyngbya sp. 'hensonii']|uniref:hypothetical protein n=1 Tax=Leptolyngbya sp. 'hensonii' TaxID=1922337 RepID=UPI001C0D58D6|nr:hypothetical protein [Leptolyngbya sp. 'hensonii']